MTVLQNGQTFPALTVPAVGGGILSLPGDLLGSYGVVLVYRGAWCPYCNAQLAGFARAVDTLTDLDIRVAALSVDDEATSATLAEQRRWTFPLGYGADPAEVANTLGAYTHDDPPYLQSTGFVLSPDATLITAVYSSGAIGRLVAQDVIGLIRYVRSASSAFSGATGSNPADR